MSWKKEKYDKRYKKTQVEHKTKKDIARNERN